MAKIIGEMLLPSKLAPDYPLSFADTNPITWEQIPEEEKINGKSYNYMNYGYWS